MDKLCEIQVVGISGEKIQPVINIGTGRHIYIGAAAHCDNALAADGILVKGMFRPGRMYREGPGIGPGFWYNPLRRLRLPANGDPASDRRGPGNQTVHKCLLPLS